MTDSAALLADEVLPAQPVRQWVLSLPFALRFLLVTDPAALTQVLGIVYRTISAYVLKRARLTRVSGATGAVTVIQRFGSALNLNIHFHMLGILARDAESSYLELDPDAGGPMDDLLGHSITYRVAMGPRAGQKVFSLQTVPARADESRNGAAQCAGFSLHAGVRVFCSAGGGRGCVRCGLQAHIGCAYALQFHAEVRNGAWL